MPKAFAENVAFRRAVLERGESSHAQRRQLWTMCSRDLLFWLNTFGVIFEPRTAKELPFITYPIQDHVILQMNDAIGHTDVGLEKSRTMGFSWMMLAVFLHRWLFRRRQSFMLVSRIADLVDKTGNSDALFWKLDYMIGYLPKWMQPELGLSDRTYLHLRNPKTESVIDGARTTGDAGRGGRRTAIGADEFGMFSNDDSYDVLGSTQANTFTRIFGSTPKGAMGGFHDLMHNPKMDMVRMKAHWAEHPLYSPGLYRSTEGRLEILDKTYKFGTTFPFILDGKLRSPWYDAECRRSPIPMLIAQELDIDYCGSTFLAFDREVILKAIKRDARPPLLRAELDYEPESAEPSKDGFREHKHGPIQLWHHLDANGRLPAQQYAMGADIATGSPDNTGRGASNSALSIYNRTTGVKVAALTVTGVDPKAFAKHVVAIGRWLTDQSDRPPRLIWEANGPGRLFGDEVMRLGYSNIFYRRREEVISKKETDIPGWWTTRESKKALFGEYQRALATGECCNRDSDALQECEHFIVMPDGSWAHRGSVGKMDPTSARDNHGDRATADALAWHLIRRVAQTETKEQVVSDYSLAGRRRREEERTKAQEYVF